MELTRSIPLPYFEASSVRGIIFEILRNEYPLKLIDLANILRRRYGKTISYQAVRKAVHSLIEEGVAEREGHTYRLSKSWAHDCKKMMDALVLDLSGKPKRDKKEIDENIRVYTFESINEMMHFWQDLIHDWYMHFKEGDMNINCYQGAHIWEGILHLDKEAQVMGQLKKKGIISYAVCTGSTPLDMKSIKLYEDLGLKIHTVPSHTSFDRSHYIGTYGDLIVEATYPKEVVAALDEFYHENTSMDKLDLKQLRDIVNMNAPLKLTVIKNKKMAEHVNASIMEQFSN